MTIQPDKPYFNGGKASAHCPAFSAIGIAICELKEKRIYGLLDRIKSLAYEL